MESDFDNLATLTGDSSWSAANMRQYLIKLEKVNYLQSLLDLVGHGTNGWLGISHTPINLALQDIQAVNSAWGAVYALGNLTGLPLNLVSALAGDMNAFTTVRDQ
jgi:choline dehydrogenase